MTPQRAKEFLPLITAYAQGKQIQYTYDGKTWEDTCDLSFTSPVSCYRVKSDPIVIKYRRFLFKCSDNSLAIGITNHDMNLDFYIENRDDIVRWIDNDWVTYECEV